MIITMLYHKTIWIRLMFWTQSLYPNFLLPLSTFWIQFKYIILQEDDLMVVLAMQNLWLVGIQALWYPFTLLFVAATNEKSFFLLSFTPCYILIKMLQNYLVGTLKSDKMTKNLSDVFSLDDSGSFSLSQEFKFKLGALNAKADP